MTVESLAMSTVKLLADQVKHFNSSQIAIDCSSSLVYRRECVDEFMLLEVNDNIQTIRSG